MNKLDTAKRSQIVRCLVDGVSIRGIEESATTDRGRRGIILSWYTLASVTSPHDPRTVIQDSVSRFVNQWLADK